MGWFFVASVVSSFVCYMWGRQDEKSETLRQYGCTPEHAEWMRGEIEKCHRELKVITLLSVAEEEALKLLEKH